MSSSMSLGHESGHLRTAPRRARENPHVRERGRGRWDFWIPSRSGRLTVAQYRFSQIVWSFYPAVPLTLMGPAGGAFRLFRSPVPSSPDPL
jgi:hypothetical protein